MDNPIQSENINEIASALAKAQGEIENAHLNKKGAFNMYATYESLRDATFSALSKHNLAMTHLLSIDNGKRVMITQISHSSGQWMRSYVCLPQEKETPQGVGSAITYAKRYALAAFVGIGSEEDDDGEEAEKPYKNGNGKEEPKNSIKVVEKKEESKLTREQKQTIAEAAAGDFKYLNDIAKSYGCTSMDQVPASKYSYIINMIKAKKEQAFNESTGT